jgi:hypothetical protein
VIGECKEGLAASFGLVFHPSEGPFNKGTPNKEEFPLGNWLRRVASYASELEPGIFTLGTHAVSSGFPMLCD